MEEQMKIRKSQIASFLTVLILLVLVFQVKGFCQTVQSELWFDDGADSLTLNCGLSGNVYCYLRDNPKIGDGATIGPIWSDTVAFNYPGNHSLFFNGGKKYVDLGFGMKLSSFTVETWFKLLDTTTTYVYLAQGCDVGEGITFHFRIMNNIEGKHKFDVWIMDLSNGGWMKMQSDDVVKYNQWMHVAVVYDVLTGGRLFLDGEEIANIPAVIEPPVLDDVFRIGHPFGSSMVGWIDDFRISDYPRMPGDGSGSGFSLAWNASLYDLAVPPPSLVSPEDSVVFTDSVQTFIWNNVPEAASYRFILSRRFDFLSQSIDTLGLSSDSLTVTLCDSSTYYWQVGACNDFGTTRWSEKRKLTTLFSHSPIDNTEMLHTFNISQNYPNPFNPVTTINYEIEKTGLVKIAIYDILGNEVDIPINQVINAGVHKLVYDASKIPAGIYFYRMEIFDFRQTRKMIIIK